MKHCTSNSGQLSTPIAEFLNSICLFESIAVKIFQLICVQLETLGIDDSFNRKTVTTFALLTYEAVFCSAFFLFEAVTLNEFIESFYISVTTIAYFFYYVTIFWKKSNIFRFIYDFETIVGNRKLILKKVHTPCSAC